MITLRVRTPSSVQRVPVGKEGQVRDVCEQLVNYTNYYISTDPQGTNTLSPDHPLSAFANGDFLYLHPILDKTDKPLNVDEILLKRSGRVKRQPDSRVCRHGDKGMCEHCQPLEPWQTESSRSGRHLPLHAYLRQQGRNLSDYKQTIPVVSSGCDRCLNRPDTKCSKCAFSTSIQLKQQPYRTIDHVLFQDQRGVEAVVEEWRRTGLQRFAYLFGRITCRSDSEDDLGVKQTIEYVFQPPRQHNAVDGVQLAGCEQELELAVKVAGLCNYTLLGCLYTDLTDDGTRTGKVVPREWFVSGAELCFMADQQSQHGDRFVTCIVSGSPDHTITPEAYMASDLAVDLHSRDLIGPCTDPHSLVSRTEKLELVYSVKNEYGYEVPRRVKSGDKVPVDYFLVSVSHGFSNEPGVVGYPPPHLHPTLEQAIEAVSTSERQSWSFPLLYHIVSLLGEGAIGLEQSELLARLLQLQESTVESGGKECAHCTFINSAGGDCAMCGLPLE